MSRGVVMLTMATALSLMPAAAVEPRSHLGGVDSVPTMVRRALPAVVSITTGRIERDQFNQPAGDVVVAIEGKPVTDLHQFHDLLQRHRIGEPVDVTVWREGAMLTLRPVPEEHR